MSSSRSIFISYRRVDSRSVTRKIYDRLAERFGHETVFRDLDSIPAGVTFKEYIEDELNQCRILIAVIGATWFEVTDRNGKRRLEHPQDWVRLEIEWALERKIPVIPLLINETKMPQADVLPGLLKVLPTRHAARMRHGIQLNSRDVARLIKDIEFQLGVSKTRPTIPPFIEAIGQVVTLEMVYVPGGGFRMGSPNQELGRYDWEGPQHEVSVPPFFMGRYPVTQRQWLAVSQLDAVGSKSKLTPEPSWFKGDNCPVEGVSWDDAVKFCAWLSMHTGKAYRLPSEAEWEYACRAGTTTCYAFGENLTPKLANYGGNNSGTTKVSCFPANGFGLYDLHGNVWEWCQDPWHKNYDGAPTDGSAWLSSDESKYRVIRGGSWDSHSGSCRSACRSVNESDNGDSDLGFRVCCSAQTA